MSRPASGAGIKLEIALRWKSNKNISTHGEAFYGRCLLSKPIPLKRSNSYVFVANAALSNRMEKHLSNRKHYLHDYANAIHIRLAQSVLQKGRKPSA